MLRHRTTTTATSFHRCLILFRERLRSRPLLPSTFISIFYITCSVSIVLYLPLCAANNEQILTECVRPQTACTIELNIYPKFSSDELRQEDEASGWGSGADAPLLYDEFHSPINVFDFTAEPKTSTYQFCKCPTNVSCSLADPERTMHLDNVIKIAFCDPLKDIFKQTCRGGRSVLRVIGELDETGETLQTAQETVTFCRCDNGYEKIGVEPWFGTSYALIYRCKH